MNPADAEEYTQALGQVVAGGWRQVALGKRLGVPTALGISTEEWVEDRLGGYVRLSLPDRREAVAELTEEGMSSDEIGDVLGVDGSTVRRDRANAQAEAEPPAAEAMPEVVDRANAQAEAEPPAEPELVVHVPDVADTDLGEQADAAVEVRRHRAMRDFMQAVEKTAALLPQIDHIIEGVLEVDAQRARDEAERARTTWERVNELLAGRSAIRRVK
jgi:hypothetical protein